MGTITKLIPKEILHRFLRREMSHSRLLVVAMSGPHAYGYPNPDSALEIKGLHVEPTENLVGLNAPPKAYNWVGELEGFRVDFSSLELGEALHRLLRGDGSILERIMAPRQMLKGEDLRRLQKVTRGVVCRRFYNHYRNFARGVARELDNGERRTVRHMLSIYRTAFTGIHLFRTGKVVVDLLELARQYRMARIRELVKLYQGDAEAMLPPDSPWVNRIVKLHALLEESLERTKLPIDPDNPKGVEEYLLDMRRRFFDAPTVRQ
ncbi:MAG: nucleotidyltransferase domain-containing protein [Deltaproteobacteria bacterium]|jgi:predicted nucleotidyltransferase|nr:nucleotidyltransferase domain-containing protein [Deltaproteobacteria bacterium]